MLALILIFILIYETINGFHDTANALATIIYTRALNLRLAIVMSGIFNFLGVVMGGLSVAYSIVHLLPTDLLLNISTVDSLCMIFSILFVAILWNISTWYVGLPSSSSHTLIGAIIGVGLANSLFSHNSIIQSINVPKIIEVCLSLIISPILGLLLSSVIFLTFKLFFEFTKSNFKKKTNNHCQRNKKTKYEFSFCTRLALIISSASVSFFHGSNDGQKGVGLIMLVLISVSPAKFVVNMNADTYDIVRTNHAVNQFKQFLFRNRQKLIDLIKYESFFSPSISFMQNKNIEDNRDFSFNIKKYPKVIFPDILSVHHEITITNNDQLLSYDSNYQNINSIYEKLQIISAINKTSILLDNLKNYNLLSSDQRSYLRRLLMYIADTIDKVRKMPSTSVNDKYYLLNLRQDLLCTIEYAPIWIIITVASSLSLGTIIGWRRVAITIGEKIGKKNMTDIQGLSAQITTALSIGMASYTGIPVSTTHILSSAVTGTMIVSCGLQKKTVKNILLIWFTTLPISILLSTSLCYLLLKLI